MPHPPARTKITSLCMSSLTQTTRTDGPPLGVLFQVEQANCGFYETSHYRHLLEIQTHSRRF